MKKKPSGSSAQCRRVEKNVKPIPDSQIDFSDIPEATDTELQRMRRAGRPASGMAKQLIAIRLSPKLLSQLRKMAAKQGKPYQSLIHELLEKSCRQSCLGLLCPDVVIMGGLPPGNAVSLTGCPPAFERFDPRRDKLHEGSNPFNSIPETR